MQLCSLNVCWRNGHTDNWSERALKNSSAHKTQQQQTLFIFTVAFYTFRFTHFRIPRHLHWLRVFWVSAVIVLLSSLVQTQTYTHTRTPALHLLLLSCSFCMSSGAVSSRPRHPSLSVTHTLPHTQTHTHARLRVNKRLCVSLRFEKSNSDLFCQAHSSPYPPPTPYRTQLTAYSTMENNKKRKTNKKVLCCCFQLQLVPYFWHSRLLKMELLFVVYRRIVAITWLGTICLHVECFYVWSTRFYRYVTSTSYQLPPTYLPVLVYCNWYWL